MGNLPCEVQRVPEPIAVDEIVGTSQLARIAREWTLLAESAPGTSPFQRPEWALAWCNAFGAEPWVLAVRSASRLIGLLPLFRKNRELSLIGAGITDYLDVLALPSRAAEVTRTVLGHLARRGTSLDFWDICDFTDVPESSPLATVALPSALTETRDSCSVCPGGLLADIPAEARRRFARARRRAERTAAVAFEVAEGPHCREAFDDLVRLHAARWTTRGEAGVLADRAVLEHHHRAIAALAERGLVRFYRLMIEGRCAAVVYALLGSETIYFYLQGIDPAFASMSPGTILIGETLAAAARDGHVYFDFLRGEELYKSLWCTHKRATTRRTLRRRQS